MEKDISGIDERLKVVEEENLKLKDLVDEYVDTILDNSASKDLVQEYAETILKEVQAIDSRLKKAEEDIMDVYQYVTDPDNDIERRMGSSEGASKEGLESLSAINEGVASIGQTFKSIESIFASLIEEKKAEEYRIEEARSEERPKARITKTGEQVKEKGGSFTDMLSSFFMNPMVIAAFSGLVYLFLPKDIKEKISGFFSGFLSEATKTSGELSTFQVALLGSAAALTTFLGAKAIEKVADAISTVVSLIKRAKTVFGNLRKKGMKGLAKTAVAVGGVAAAGAVAAEVLDEPEAEEKPTPAATPSAAPTGSPAAANAAPDTRPPVSGTSLPSVAPGSAEDPMNADLNQYVKKKDTGVDLEGLHPNLKKRLAGMAMEYNEKTGKKIQINSAYRDPQEQAELYAKIGPPKAAPPGRSKHEVGAAFDMNSADADGAIQLGLFDKYGFTRPVRGETWHVEPVENRGGSFPDNPVSPGRPVIVASASGAVVPGSGAKVPENITKPKVSAVASTAPTGGDIAELKSEPAALESNMADSGTSVMATSEETEASYGTGKEAIIANSLDMSRQVADKEGMTPPPPIPSPVANRSDLGGNLKHTTAYAMA